MLLLFLRLTTWMLEELYPLILYFTQFWSLACPRGCRNTDWSYTAITRALLEFQGTYKAIVVSKVNFQN